MGLDRRLGSSAVAMLFTPLAGKAGAMIPAQGAAPSFAERVAAIRARSAPPSPAGSAAAAIPMAARPAQVAWNDWKNE